MTRFHAPFYGLFHLLDRQTDPEALRLTLLGCLSIIVPGGGYAMVGLNSQKQVKIIGNATHNSPLIPPCFDTAKRFILHAEVGDYSATNDALYVAVSGVTGKPEVVIISAEVASTHYEIIQALCVHYNCLVQLIGHSVTDSLTGLFNRKAFDYVLERTYARLLHDKTRQKPIRTFVAMVDIDHFKSVNDNYGHLFGDEVLLRVSQVIHDCVREHDRAFRYGGEEFAVMLNGLDEEQAIAACERMRKQINQCEFPQLDHISASLGIEKFSSELTPICCVEHADAALYYSKEHGRNQVNSYWQLVATGELKEKTAIDDIELF